MALVAVGTLSGSEAAAVACKEPGQWRRAMELLEISVWQRLVPNEILYEVAITSSQQANYLRPSILLLESLSARTASSMLPAKNVKFAGGERVSCCLMVSHGKPF